MEFQDVVRRRRMVRNFTDEPVPGDVLDRILTNALHAPSAGFSQGWAFLVLEGSEQTGRFWSASWGPSHRRDFQWPGLFRAPVLIVPLSHKQAYLDRYAEPDKGVTEDVDAYWPVPYWDIDTGFAALLMLLTAVDAGLGACFFSVRPARLSAVRDAFTVPDSFTPIGAIALGYGAPDRRSRSVERGRRPVEEVVHRGQFRSEAASSAPGASS